MTEAFAIASVVSARTRDLWLRGAAWGLADAVGWERTELDRRRSPDVVAGALIGAEVGHRMLVRHRRRAPRRVELEMVHSLAPKEWGVAGSVTW